MSRGAGVGVVAALGFPRVSGDEPHGHERVEDQREFSPRERG